MYVINCTVTVCLLKSVTALVAAHIHSSVSHHLDASGCIMDVTPTSAILIPALRCTFTVELLQVDTRDFIQVATPCPVQYLFPFIAG